MKARVRKRSALSDGLAGAALAALFCAAAFVWAADAPKPPASRPASRPATAPADPDLYAWWRAADAGKDEAPDASGRRHAAKPLAGGKIATEAVNGRKAFRIKSDGGGVLSAGADAGFDFSADFSVALRVELSG